MSSRELNELPAITSLFARSLIPGSKDALLPDLELTVRDHVIDPANLAAYQKLCGFDISSRLPATYIHTQAFPLAVAVMADRAFPFPLMGLIHVHNRMTQFRPVDAAEELTLRVWASDLREHATGRQVDLNAEVNVGDDRVWTGVSTYLHREKVDPRDAPVRKPKAINDPPVPDALWRLGNDLGRRYAAVSGDRNPIHLSSLAAKAFGFPKAIAHGMWLHSRAIAAVSPLLPDAYVVDAAFKTPALLGTTVAFEADRDHAGDWTLQISAARSGKPHFSATTHPVADSVDATTP
ncbi:MAG: MaoC domain protein dehydratase [Pseudonocardiales bacterium]|nr:MaoC domain protein dehydratase [Pseudonocardiales bacterium]